MHRKTILWVIPLLAVIGCGWVLVYEDLTIFLRSNNSKPLVQNPVPAPAHKKVSDATTREQPLTTEKRKTDHTKIAVNSSKPPVKKTPAPAPEHARVEIDLDRINLHVRNKELAAILDDISAKTGISFTDHTDAKMPLITLDFDNVTLEEAIKKLLAGFDVLFFYRAASAGFGKLESVWIYPKGHHLYGQPSKTEDSAVGDALFHSDSAKRALAFEEVLQRPESISPEVLLAGLLDVDAEVRLRVISQALMNNVTLPADTLEELALDDPSAEVRLAALSAMGFHPEIDMTLAEAIAQDASYDPDPMVQSQAMELLEHLEAMQTGATTDALESLEREDEMVDPGQMAEPSDLDFHTPL